MRRGFELCPQDVRKLGRQLPQAYAETAHAIRELVGRFRTEKSNCRYGWLLCVGR